VRKPKFVSRSDYNGSNIRKLIASGEGWNNLVPPAVAKAIEGFGGVERIRMLAGADAAPHMW
jgi:nicotinamide-nucleotide adenylyltransferase